MRRACRYFLLFILPIIVGASSVWAYNTNPPGLDMKEYQGVVEAYKVASVLPEPTPTIVGSPELHKPLETSIFEDDFEGGAGSWTHRREYSLGDRGRWRMSMALNPPPAGAMLQQLV